MPLPLFYTTNEGGRWKPWTSGWVDDKVLDAKWLVRRIKAADLSFVPINKTLVHSLAFDIPHGMPFDSFERWDCINGWTQRVLLLENRKGQGDG